MSNKQTSQLAAVAALDFADIFALVQGGNSRRASAGQLRDLLDGQSSRTLIKPPSTQGRMSLSTANVRVTPNGASVTATGLIPERSIVLCVTTYVIGTLTGTMSSFDVGTSDDLSRFGGNIGITAGSSNIGVVGPFATYSPTDVVVTLNGGNGSTNGNKLRLVAYYIHFDTPAA